MKKDFFYTTLRPLGFLALILTVWQSAHGQTTWIANANAGAVAGPTTFTGTDAIIEAIAAAASGDVIYVVPSGEVYDAIQVTKSLAILGGGFNPENSSTTVSTINGIDLATSDIRIAGVRVLGQINSSVAGTIANIMIDKCRIRSIHLTTSTDVGNLVVQNCLIGENTSLNEGQLNLTSGVSSPKLLNNIIYIRSQMSVPSGIVAGTVENNLFVGVSSSPSTQDAFGSASNCLIRNNIFYGVEPTGGTGYEDNTQEYNISFGGSDNTFPVINGNTSSNNLEGVDPLFVNMVNSSGFQFSYDVSLQSSSPGKGTGSDGTDRGVFGGLVPYDVHGSPLPAVQSVVVPSMVTEGSDMTVRVKAQGN